jgi:hypothetical protein
MIFHFRTLFFPDLLIIACLLLGKVKTAKNTTILQLVRNSEIRTINFSALRRKVNRIILWVHSHFRVNIPTILRCKTT